MRTVAEHRECIELLLTRRDKEDQEEEISLVGDASLSANNFRRVLSRDVRAPIDLPPFTNSQMDGYTVHSDDLRFSNSDAPIRLRVVKPIAAGSAIASFERGTAAPIMTGAPIPIGADAVVPIEQVDPPHFLKNDQIAQGKSVGFMASAEPGTFVRDRGTDIEAGSVLLEAGVLLGPAQLGILASCGIDAVWVRSRPRVLLLSTGEELRAPGDALGSGQIYDANTATMTAALLENGASVVQTVLPDQPESIEAVIRSSGADTDFVLTTGGVSAGAFEVVREALEKRGVQFVSVAMQPGGPQGVGMAILPEDAGHRSVTIPVIAFPGNPVSALVSFEMFLRPVVRILAGLPYPRRRVAHGVLATDVSSPVMKHQVRRGILNNDGKIELIGGPSSHLLHSYALSRVLVHIPDGVARVNAGETVEIWSIDDSE